MVDVAAMQASFDRAGRLIDRYLDDHPTGSATIEAAQQVYGEVQASKAFLTSTAVRVVDRLALSGGAGYAAPVIRSPRRGGTSGRRLHAPRGANRADTVLARTALGLTM